MLSGELAQKAWWERLDRAAKRQRMTTPGSKVMSDWAHDMLAVIGDAVTGSEIVPGHGWQPVPPERRTEEYVESEKRRLTDELGVRLGIGQCPDLLPQADTRLAPRSDCPANTGDSRSRTDA